MFINLLNFINFINNKKPATIAPVCKDSMVCMNTNDRQWVSVRGLSDDQGPEAFKHQV